MITKERVKKNGQVFTPQEIVETILNKINYRGKKILTRTIIDNSCGTGNFLLTILDRFCQTFLKYNQNKIKLKQAIEKTIFGIEIDKELWKKCLSRLDAKASEYGLFKINWQVFNKDALKVRKFDNKMDYVVGNPPYVRIHNLASKINLKQFVFCQKGSYDLFLAFFEIGLKMLRKNGKLSYISSNSYFRSLAGERFRDHIIKNHAIVYLKDLGWKKIFANYRTYPAIIVLNKNKQKRQTFLYEDFKNVKKRLRFDLFIEQKTNKVQPLFFDKSVREILNAKVKKQVIVKNGFATLNDRIFLQAKTTFFGFRKHIIQCLKASTGKWFKAFFPYTKNRALAWNELKQHQAIKTFLLKHKKTLDKSTKDNEWYLFGRNQGVKDVFKPRLAMNNLIKSKKDIKMQFLKAGQGVFSGYYITFENENLKKKIPQIIQNDRFINFINKLGFYKQRGFCFFRSKDLESFINYELHKK